jgi:hypothetical protein
MALLASYNLQRVKTVASLLREAIPRDSKTVEATAAAVRRVHTTRMASEDPEYIEIDGSKHVEQIAPNRMEFLNAASAVIEELKDYWPLSIRQVHYRLLNDPPLMMKRTKFDVEDKYRYRNDKTSYQALSRLLTGARYHGHIPFHVIDDPTRPFSRNWGFDDLTEFVEYSVREFLLGYHRDKQTTQPIHIEVLGEKTFYAYAHRYCAPGACRRVSKRPCDSLFRWVNCGDGHWHQFDQLKSCHRSRSRLDARRSASGGGQVASAWPKRFGLGSVPGDCGVN